MDLKTARKFISLESSARKRGLDFNLTLQSVANLISSENCFYTGVKLNNQDGHPFQRTIDRVDNQKGYVKGNVVACSLEINLAKGRLTVEQIKQISNGLRRKLK